MVRGADRRLRPGSSRLRLEQLRQSMRLYVDRLKPYPHPASRSLFARFFEPTSARLSRSSCRFRPVSFDVWVRREGRGARQQATSGENHAEATSAGTPWGLRSNSGSSRSKQVAALLKEDA